MSELENIFPSSVSWVRYSAPILRLFCMISDFRKLPSSLLKWTYYGRTIGGKLTASERQIIREKKYLESDFLSVFGSQTENGHSLVHSAYFIKENQELIGLLCVSHNTDALLEAWHAVSALTSSFYLPRQNYFRYSEEAGGLHA